MAINLQLGTELLYSLIYLLSQTKLATLKEFLKKNLKKGFIKELKSLASTLILFTLKKNSSLRLCVNY